MPSWWALPGSIPGGKCLSGLNHSNHYPPQWCGIQAHIQLQVWDFGLGTETFLLPPSPPLASDRTCGKIAQWTVQKRCLIAPLLPQCCISLNFDFVCSEHPLVTRPEGLALKKKSLSQRGITGNFFQGWHWGASCMDPTRSIYWERRLYETLPLQTTKVPG